MEQALSILTFASDVIAMAAAHEAMAAVPAALPAIGPGVVAGSVSGAAQPPLVIEPLGDEDLAPAAAHHGGRRGRPRIRARTAGPYWSDDVLDPDGYPASPPIRSRSPRDLNE